MRKLVYMILLVTFSTTCDLSTGGGLDRPPEGPKILRVEVSPEYITVGDTVTVRCIIEDSLNLSYDYSWRVAPPSGSFSSFVTKTSYADFTPQMPGKYDVQVRVERYNPQIIPSIFSIVLYVNE